MPEYKLYNGDCRKVLFSLDNESVDLVVTSPPYDNLRTYEGTCEWNFKIFKQVAYGLYKTLKCGGVVVWVIGDATINGSETGSSFRQALYFKEIGFNLHDTMIYQKVNPIPQNHNRYEQTFEYMFVFSKGKPHTFNPLKVETKNAGKEFKWGNRKLLDKKQCRRIHDENEKLTVKGTKNRGNIWDYAIGVSGNKSGHPAVFPKQLANDHIISWSNEGDTVLDPFMGSGTTGEASLRLNRNFIGIEKVESYFNLSEERIAKCFKEMENAEKSYSNINSRS